MALLQIKKIGNHWYPDILHDRGVDISLSKKIERVLNKVSQTDSITISIDEVYYTDHINNLIYFNEEDITRYFVTDDEFNMRFKVNNHEFEINSNLYFYITKQLELSFHFCLYTITLYEN